MAAKLYITVLFIIYSSLKMKRFSNQIGEFEALLEGSIPECLVWGLVKYGRFF